MSMEENALAIGIREWLPCFGKSIVRWGTLTGDSKAGRTRYGVIVTLPADVTLLLEDEDDEFENLLQLREAIDLVRLTMATQPEVAAHLFGHGGRRRSVWEDEEEEERKTDPEALEALARGVPSELRLFFHFHSLKTRMLADQLATNFIETMGASISTNYDFLTIRNELVAQIQDHDAVAEPVRVTFSVDSTEIENFSLLEAEDFFIGLTDVAQKLAEDSTTSDGEGTWTEEEHHTPLVVDKIELGLHRFCITHRVVKAAQAFMDAGIPVDCKRINLDLRLISCAEDDLLAFVSAVTRGATKLFIKTGVDLNEDDTEPVDMDYQDRSESIEMILCVIASVEHAFEVHLGGLFTLCIESTNREVILRYVVEQFVSRAQPLNSLSFGNNLVFEEQDCLNLERIATEYRAAHPGVKLHAKRLTLVFEHVSSARDLTRALSAFNDAEEVEIGANVTANPISLDLLPILRFPSLRCIRLHKVCIPSMDFFDPTITDPQLLAKPVLEELRLDGVEFRDIASVGRFVKKLKSPSESELANTLRTLEICPIFGNRLSNQAFFDHEAMLALLGILESSRVLSRLTIYVNPADKVVFEDGALVLSHTRSKLPRPLASRSVDHVKARNMAFLSVIRDGACDPQSARCGLDARVVSLIFELSAPTMERRVHVGHIEPLDDDEDDEDDEPEQGWPL